MSYKIERYDRDYARIVDARGGCVGGIARLSNGTWAVMDTRDRRLTARCFRTVPMAFDWWCMNAAQAIEAQRAETSSGSVEDESAVGNADAPNSMSQQHGKGGRG